MISPFTTSPRPTLSQVTGNQELSPQESARTELLSDSNASGAQAQPVANEGRTIEIDISRTRRENSDLNKVKDEWIKALKANDNTGDVKV